MMISYGPLSTARHERRLALRTHFFYYTCPTYQIETPFEQTSELRRLIMAQLDRQTTIFRKNSKRAEWYLRIKTVE